MFAILFMGLQGLCWFVQVAVCSSCWVTLVDYGLLEIFVVVHSRGRVSTS